MAELDENKVNEAPKSDEPKPEPVVNKDNDEIAKLKAALSKANSEAAEWKRQYKSTLDEQKQKELEAAELRKAELAELETLRAEKRVGNYAKQFMGMGIDPETAESMAKSLPDGVTDEFFSVHKAYLENQRKNADIRALNNQPSLSVGMPPSNVSPEDAMLDKIFGLK